MQNKSWNSSILLRLTEAAVSFSSHPLCDTDGPQAVALQSTIYCLEMEYLAFTLLYFTMDLKKYLSEKLQNPFVPKVIDFQRYSMKCSGENVILRGIFHIVSGFPLHFMLYGGNLECFSNSVVFGHGSGFNASRKKGFVDQISPLSCLVLLNNKTSINSYVFA